MAASTRVFDVAASICSRTISSRRAAKRSASAAAGSGGAGRRLRWLQAISDAETTAASRRRIESRFGIHDERASSGKGMETERLRETPRELDGDLVPGPAWEVFSSRTR